TKIHSPSTTARLYPAAASKGEPEEISRRISGGLGEDFAADKHAADLRGPGADLVELCVAQQPPGREVVDVAVAAEDLHRIERQHRRLLGGVEDGAGGVLACRLPAIARPGDRIDIGFASVHRRIHVGELALDQLKLADRLAELLAVVDIGDNDIE